MIETRLHILLAERRMSQKDLSEATGIGKNTISRYYNNTWTKINKEDIDVLCKFFKCDIEDIFYYTPIKVTLTRARSNSEDDE